MTPTYSPEAIASTFASLLSPHLADPARPAFYLWARPDRAVISVNPRNLKALEPVLSEKFRHALSTNLGGVQVVKTNSMGVFFQVAYTPTPPAPLVALPLDLSQQPGALAVPIGVTTKGPLWIDITEMGSVLLGGARRMGKTRLLHGWIQALIAGGACELVLYDGKDGLEFSRYANETGVTFTNDLPAELARLSALVAERRGILETVKAVDLAAYNARVPSAQRLLPVVLVIDEAALIDPETADVLARLVAVSGAHGIIPVLATQRTGTTEVRALTKTNLLTRIALSVPASQDSMVILGRAGAEKLPNKPGRLLMVWNARPVEAQAYLVDLPGMPEITGREIELAQWALEKHNGRLSIPLLRTGQGMTEWDARELLSVWEARGWLEGRSNGVSGRVSPALAAVASRSSSASSLTQGLQGSVSTETEGENQ